MQIVLVNMVMISLLRVCVFSMYGGTSISDGISIVCMCVVSIPRVLKLLQIGGLISSPTLLKNQK